MSRGKPEIDRERCKGCSLCIEVCPQRILKMSNEVNRQGLPFTVCFDNAGCTACVSCAIICPDAAIRVFRAALRTERETADAPS